MEGEQQFYPNYPTPQPTYFVRLKYQEKLEWILINDVSTIRTTVKQTFPDIVDDFQIYDTAGAIIRPEFLTTFLNFSERGVVLEVIPKTLQYQNLDTLSEKSASSSKTLSCHSDSFQLNDHFENSTLTFDTIKLNDITNRKRKRARSDTIDRKLSIEDLRNYILEFPGGKEVIGHYQINKSLDDRFRKRLVNICVNHMLKDLNGGTVPSNKTRARYAKGIITLFPSLKDNFSDEGYEAFFDPLTKKGFITNRIRTLLRENVKHNPNSSEENACINITEHPDIELEKIKDTLKFLDPITSREEILKKHFETLSLSKTNRLNLSSEFPRLLDTEGLVSYEFYLITKKDEDVFLTKYPEYIDRIFTLYEKTITKRNPLLSHEQNEYWNRETKSLLILLELLPPPATGRKGCQKRETAASAIGKLIKFHKEQVPLETALQDRPSSQPFLLAVGTNEAEVGRYYVVFDAFILPAGKTVLESFDFLVKVHYVFNISYHSALDHFFNFVTNIFYDIPYKNMTSKMRENVQVGRFKMYICFICKMNILNLSDLMRHLKKNHALCEGTTLELLCPHSGCINVYKSFSGYRKHLQKCQIGDMATTETVSVYKDNKVSVTPDQNSKNRFTLDFSQSITANSQNTSDQYFSSYVSRMYSLSIPETTIQIILESTKELISHIINNRLVNGGQSVVHFDHLSTKFKRNKYFRENIIIPREITIGIRYDKKWCKEQSAYIQVPVTCKFSYIPILECLSFLSNNDSFLKLLMKEQHQSTLLREYSDGSHYKNSSFFKNNKFAFQLHLYFDEFETVNPLGSKTGGHKVGAIYMIIKNIPSIFNSVIHNIHLVALFYSNDIKTFGFNSILDVIVNDIRILESEGIFVPKLGYNLKGTLVALSHDNLGGNQIFGLVESFSAHHYCRICLAKKEETKTMCLENKSLLRTNASYESHCRLISESDSYGIKFRSSLNNLCFFKLCENPSVDIMHDLLEGVVQLEIKLFLKYLISEKLITIQAFNERMKSFNFGILNVKNHPSPICLDKLGNSIGQRAAQTWCLLRFFPLIIYDILKKLTRQQYAKFNVILLLIEIASIVLSPICSDGLTVKLQLLIESHHKTFLNEYEHHLIPKHHMMIHYPGILRKMGPLVGLWCMRFEAKHGYFKHLVHSLKNFNTLCKTLAFRHQKHMWSQWKVINLTLEPTFGKCFLKNIANEPYADQLKISLDVKISNLKFTKQIKCFGITFRTECFITWELNNLCPLFYKIVAICIHNSHTLIVCEPWETQFFDKISQSYIVKKYAEHTHESAKIFNLKDLQHFNAYDLITPYNENFSCIVPKYETII